MDRTWVHRQLCIPEGDHGAETLLLLTINRALPVLGIPDFWQRAVVGALIIGAIILDRVLANRQAKRLLAERVSA